MVSNECTSRARRLEQNGDWSLQQRYRPREGLHYERIDVLINNAGFHAFEQCISMDGFAEMVAVNYLAPPGTLTSMSS